MSKNSSAVYDTLFKATKNIYLCENQSLMTNDTTIREILPKKINEDVFYLNSNFVPQMKQLIPRHKFQVYTESINTGIFACFNKAKKKQMVTFDCGFVIYKENSKEIYQFVNFNACSVTVKRGLREIYITINLPTSEQKNQIEFKEDNEKKKDRLIFIETDHGQETQKIDEILDHLIQVSQGSKKSLRYTAAIPNFLKPQFQRICETGDILLFKNKPANNSQQGKSKNKSGELYQHVALVVRNIMNDIIVLQKNKDGKIGINYWLNIVNYQWYKYVEKIAYRKLEIQRNNQFLTAFENWMIKSLDKQYSTNLSEIYNVPPQTSVPIMEEKSIYESCDFVAQCYNKVGIINISRQSTQFWPIDFTELRQFPFNKGNFGREHIIAFSPSQKIQEQKEAKQ